MSEALLLPWVFPAIALFLGLCLGSFYNVCVHRYLTGQSIVWPGSHCPACGHVLSWWENIPVFSYIILKARCRSCQGVIHWRYPAVELLSGLLALLLALKFGPSLAWVAYMVFAGIFLVASFIDLDSFILPDMLTYPAAILAWATPFCLPVSWFETLWGSIAGAGAFLLLQQGYLRLRGLEALGTGDIKLMLSLGALVGLSKLPIMVLLSAVSGLLVALAYLRRPDGEGLRTAIPFGPFLCLGAVLTLLWGEELQGWLLYLGG
ncbi:MAG: prepilin peptidase [Desulfovibrionales bacterium]|nr:prepilin peptidase [Desulfovibrionales bacterium]